MKITDDDRTLIPLDKQSAVTMNRDTIYSFGIFYAPKGTQLRLAKVEGRSLPVCHDPANGCGSRTAPLVRTLSTTLLLSGTMTEGAYVSTSTTFIPKTSISKERS
jgi:hypothetical protein